MNNGSSSNTLIQIYKGVTVMPDTFKHKSQFQEVNEWLQPLR